jgi:hypothetical protein
VAPLHPLGERRVQRVEVLRQAVAVILSLDEAVQRGLHGRRDLEVGVGHERGEYVGRIAAPLAAAPLPQLGGGEQEVRP